MNKGWSARSEAERKALEAAFVARHSAELLVDGDAEHGHAVDDGTVPDRRPLPFAELYAALQRPGPLPREVAAALRDDPRRRDELAVLLERRAHRHVRRAAAAAGRGALRRREVDGFTIRVVESRARSDQVYLLIELPESIIERSTDTDRPRDPDTSGVDASSAPNTGDAAAPLDVEPDEPRGHGTREGSGTNARFAAPVQLVVKTATEEFLKRELPPPEGLTIRLVAGADDPLVRAVGEPASEIFLW